MTVAELLEELSQHGVELWASGDRLRYRAPKGVLTPARLAELSQQKAEILALLRQRAGEADSFHPLSYGQQALWLLYQLAPASAAYNVMCAARIRSALDIPALRRAFQALIDRHASLQTTYAARNGRPVQQIHAQQTLHFEVIDAATWGWDYLNDRMYEEADHPFDLERGPVLRAKLFTRSAQEYVLLLTVHHIAVDFWSFELLLNDLAALYTAEKAGAPAVLPPLRRQYTDYIHWQTEMLAGPEGERLWGYWQKQLAGELPALNLPLDRPRPAIQTYRGAAYHFQLNEELARQLKALAKAEGATLYMTLLAAFQVLLYRYSGQEDLMAGSPTAGRSRAELEGIVGYFVNPIVLRADLSGNPAFNEFLGRTRQTVLAALAHADYPFPLLVERLQPKRDPSRSPLFQVQFVWHRSRQSKEQGASSFDLVETAPRGDRGGLELEILALGQRGARFDLTLTVDEAGETLSADLQYNSDLFDPATIARMAGHFQTLLEGIAVNPRHRISDLPLLTEAERHHLLVEWNDTKADYPQDLCLHQMIEAQAEQSPDAVAVVFEGEQLTYRELNRRANQLAHHLQALGVGPEALVGICMERSLEMVVGLLGILKAGGAYVPLDPTYPKERLAFMLAESKAPVLLTQQRLVEALPSYGAKVICLDSEWANIAKERVDNPLGGAKAENLAYVIYTSGSTGKPKGAMNLHRAICNRLLWMQEAYHLTEADRVLQKTPFSFDVSVWEFFWPLMTGACLVVARPGGHQDSAYLVRLIAGQKITTLHFVPSMLQVFLEEEGLETCNCLKRVICSGEALSFKLQERFFARLDAELHNLYGPTEAAVDVTFWACQRESHHKIVPIGRPIANTQIYLLDACLNPVPIGVPGELHIGGAGLARGYFNRPELTVEKFIPNPFSDEPGARLYKTGDLARYLPDGNIEFLGRIDHQVKIHGFRIELGEIEAVLGEHPNVRENVVVAREDGPANKRLAAYLVPRQSPGPTVNDLRNFLKKQLPDYMVPAAFVLLDALPLTPNGKVDRRALPSPDPTRPALEETFVAPRNQIEKLLAEIWADILGIDNVGIHDNFFDLGGASIQSLEVAARAKEAGLMLTAESFFEHQTIAELAAACEVVSPPAARGNTIIESLGVYLPPKVVSTEEVLQGCKNKLAFPLERMTGIKSRRVAGESEFSIDLARKAVADCLAKSKYNPRDIDLLICCNISRCDGPNFQFSFEPGTSIKLKKHFGFDRALVFDISSACTGMFTAINIVDAFIKAGMVKCGMVASGEYISHLAQTAQKEIEGFLDSRLACLTVGDAGAAIILEEAPGGEAGFHAIDMLTLSRYSSYCIARATDKEHGGAIMFTESIKLTEVSVKNAAKHSLEVLKQNGWSPESFQHLIMHQTSRTTLGDAVREVNSLLNKKAFHEGNTIDNLAERGNTATTSHFVAIMDNIRSNKINAGDKVVFSITGSGQTIGTALYTFDDFPDRLRRMESSQQGPPKISTAGRIAPAPRRRVPRIRIENIGIIPQDHAAKRNSLELLKIAAGDCLEKSSHHRSDIGLLIHAGVYRNDFICEPAIASLLAGELDINATVEPPEGKKTLAFDVFNGAIGFLNACYVAIRMIQAQKFKTAMIVASEIENNAEVFPEKLLGLREAGSALILDEAGGGKTGFGNFLFKYFPDYLNAYTAYCAWKNGKTYLHFNKDRDLEAYYLQAISEAVRELLRLEGLDISQIDVIFPPQISSTFISKLSDRMKLGKDKFVDIAGDGKDLFTSSVPYALQYARERDLVEAGDIGLIISAGSGIQAGCAIYYF